jgi:hypothetical protein
MLGKNTLRKLSDMKPERQINGMLQSKFQFKFESPMYKKCIMKLTLNGMECMSGNTLIHIQKYHKESRTHFYVLMNVFAKTLKFHIANKTSLISVNLFIACSGVETGVVHTIGGCTRMGKGKAKDCGEKNYAIPGIFG